MSPYSRILAYVLPNLGFFLLSSLGYFLFAISQVGIADWFRQIVDYISQPDTSLNLYLPILLFVLAFGRGIGYFVGNFFMALVSTRLVFDLRKDLFKSLIYLPSSFYDSNNSGHLLSRITFNVAQINDQQKSEIDKFNSVNSNNRIQNLKLETTNSLQSPIIQIFLAIALAIITWVALDSSFFERMSPGTFIAFFGAAAMLPRPIRQLSMTNSMIQKGLAAAEVIFNQMDVKPEIDDGTKELSEVRGDISFENVNFSYSDNEKILDDVSFTISKGNTLAIVGQSGSGKSTMVNLIPRFYEILEGRIEIDGCNVKEIKLDNLRSLISTVSQNTVLFNDSIKNNISYAKPMASDEEIFEAARNANAHDFIESLPNGYETVVGDDGTLLSGGQKQRIAIARALLKDAPIIILDEATSALDSESENQIQQAIDNLKIGKTTIVIAHRLSTVENAEKIIVLKDGKIVESGRHNDLMSLEKAYFELYKNQFKDEVEPAKKKLPILKSQFALSEQKTSNFIEEAWYENKNWIKRKTPLVIWLANELKKEGLYPGIVSRGYKSTAKNNPVLITQSSNPSDVGDEPLIIFNNTNCPVVVGANRVRAAKHLIQNRQCNILISDDGLQHFKLGRDIEIAMIDGIRKFGNNLLLPAGPLREPIKKLDQVDFVINTNTFFSKESESKDNNFLMTYKPISWVNLVTQESIDINDWNRDRIVYGIAGIGNPSSFFSLLRSLDFQVIEKVFPDHHEFIDTDFFEMNDLPIVMTEKDAIKCKFLKNPNCWYLKIEPVISEDFKTDLFKKII